jgi:hypothetical protein
MCFGSGFEGDSLRILFLLERSKECQQRVAGLKSHATFTIPNFQQGYCTDDNARALILMMLLNELKEDLPQRYQITALMPVSSRTPSIRSCSDSATFLPSIVIGWKRRDPKIAMVALCGRSAPA